MEEKLKETPQFKKVGDPEWESFVEQRRAEARRRQQQATVNPYIWRDFEHFPTAWIARDEDGSLWLYDKKPRCFFITWILFFVYLVLKLL